MPELPNETKEKLAQAMFKNTMLGKGEQVLKKDIAKEIGITAQHLGTLACKDDVVLRIQELQRDKDRIERNKDILDKNARLRLLTKIIDESDDADTKIKAIQALDKLDTRGNEEQDEDTKQIIIQLPDNKRSK